MQDFLCIYQPPTGGTFRFRVNADNWDGAQAALVSHVAENFERVVLKYPNQFKAWVEGISF